MKGPFRFGGQRPARSAFDLDRGPRVTVWQSIARQPHVLVAAVGTVALLGLSGTAIWMVLPSNSVEPLITRGNAASAQPTEEPARPARVVPTEAAPAVSAEPAAKAASATPAPAGDVPGPQVAATAEPEPLDLNDPRWSAKAHAARASASAAAVQKRPVPTTDLLAAYGEDMRRDEDPTSAIPMPGVKVAQAEDVAETDDSGVESAGRPGRTARAVTMRSRPNVRGGVLGTVPARTEVSVIGCKQWCEIVYKGKRGFIYKSFLSR